MKSIYKAILLFSVLVLITSCVFQNDENLHRTIWMVNKSGCDIYTIGDFSYPDTTDQWIGIALNSPYEYKIESYKKNDDALRLRDAYWEPSFMDKRIIPSGTLMVFIMDSKKLEAHNIHINEIILQRYDVTFEDLQRVNWVLSYPPSENMKDIKMWPPYKKQE